MLVSSLDEHTRCGVMDFKGIGVCTQFTMGWTPAEQTAPTARKGSELISCHPVEIEKCHSRL